jgi:methylated-DNA-protein-cysteine methyltransferase-like protein
MPGSWSEIYKVIKCIPSGCVATYGQVARLAGRPNGARQVGYALSALTDPHSVPWHRVVNARGEVSIRSNPDYAQLQKQLLIEEGVTFDANGRIRMSRYQWERVYMDRIVE